MLNKIKALLDLTHTHEMDDKITVIYENVEDRLKLLLKGVDEIPQELLYIVLEVSVSRFNRIGSEGLSSHNVEGESLSWNKDDFAPYMDDIEEWIEQQKRKKNSSRGKVIFI